MLRRGSAFVPLLLVTLIVSFVFPTSSFASNGTHRAKVLWKPKLDSSFQLQLAGRLVTNVKADVYDVDMFDTSVTQIAELKKLGHKVVCYFSAGTGENWRSDYKRFAKSDLGNPDEGWPGENWLDIRSSNVRRIMLARMDLAANKGCDGIDPDNVEGYGNDSGFPLKAQDQLKYDKFLATEAHSRNLSVGLKNDINQLSDLASSFDFAVNEQCHEFDECAGYRAFTSLGKPVLDVEYQKRYVENADGAFVDLCTQARSEKLYLLVLPLQLDGSFRLSC